jgi:hypothetical protein
MTIAALWPSFAIATLPPLICCAAIVAGLAVLDARVLKRDPKLEPAWASWTVIAICGWTFLLATFLPLIVHSLLRAPPTGRDPILLAALWLQLVTTLLMTLGSVACGLFGAARLSTGITHRPGWTAVAWVCYIATWQLFPKFMPTV